MSKHIVILNGSPRLHGNTAMLCDAFAEGAAEAGHIVTRFDLQRMDIRGCLGCVKGGKDAAHPCVQKDDMAPLLDKLVAADVIVLATPVYFYSMDGQLKTFIDRTVPRYTEIADKDFYFILTSADTQKKNLARTVEALRGFTQDCLENAHEKAIIYGTGAWQKGEIKNTPAFEQAYQAGKNC